ncbi:BtrH N-terminal domain-containing protein [Kitasatospora sp. NPDC085879]|uniref:BtrH N-terminal domain-containing protein n=1 Tax=Kitasatospora sp. NPDC085879 TaxID=3154769 RepID=UPI0034335AC8
MAADTPPRVHHVTGAPPELWYRDLASCLQATFGAVLLRAGHDPLEVLGAAWQFLYRPGEVRSEEFYFPTRYEGDLGRGIAPHHPLTSAWRTPDDPADPLAGLRAALDADRPVIAAVDNHHLPFRPAYHDVHAAHLVTVFGLDEYRGLVHVADATPPAFRGAVPLDAFLAAWDSANPSDVQDAFFSDSRIGRRWLDVEVGGPYPRTTPERLAGLLRADAELFTTGKADGPDGAEGLAGLARFTEELVDRSRAGDPAAIRDLYPFGWGMQAQASLHGELLRRLGAAWYLPVLAGAGRAVEAVAHAWTGVRMTGAHGREDPSTAAGPLARHTAVLRRRYAEAVEAVLEAVDALPAPA